MSPAFLHGDPFVVLFFPIGLGIVLFLGNALVFYLAVKHTKLPALYLPAPYLISVLTLGVLLAVSAPRSALYFLSFLSTIVLTLPGSALGWWGLQAVITSRSEAIQFATVTLLGAGLNALILYWIGIKVRRKQRMKERMR